MPKNCKQLKVLSLFSGCGGMDLGFEGGFQVLRKSINKEIHPEWAKDSNPEDIWIDLPKTVFNTIFANDILKAAKASWIPYFSKRGRDADCFNLNSIVDLVKQSEISSIFPQADLITGGFPCQDFSIAGKRKGFNSPVAHHGESIDCDDNPTEENRGMLYAWMRKVVSIVLPKVFIAENVKGLVSLPDVKQIIEKDFSNIGSGYLVVDAKVLYAPDYGVPQSRSRVFFIGFRKDALKKQALIELGKSCISDKYNPFPLQTHKDGKDRSLFTQGSLLPYVTAGDCLNDLPEPDFSSDLSHQSFSKAKWYGKHCQGQTELDLAKVGPTIRAEHHGNIEFRRLAAEHGGKNFEELDAGLPERRLSVRECARLQTFPDDFEFVRNALSMGKDFRVSASDAYRLVGNAVPPLLAYHLAWRLQELWELIF